MNAFQIGLITYITISYIFEIVIYRVLNFKLSATNLLAPLSLLMWLMIIVGQLMYLVGNKFFNFFYKEVWNKAPAK